MGTKQAGKVCQLTIHDRIRLHRRATEAIEAKRREATEAAGKKQGAQGKSDLPRSSAGRAAKQELAPMQFVEKTLQDAKQRPTAVKCKCGEIHSPDGTEDQPRGRIGMRIKGLDQKSA